MDTFPIGKFLFFAYLACLLGCSGKASTITVLNSMTPSTPSDPPSIPVVPSLPLEPKKIAVGARKAFAVTSAGVAQSWGANYEYINSFYGQLGLGLGTNVNRTTPQTVDGATVYTAVSSGETLTCGITNLQKLKCWGRYIGDGSGTTQLSPTLNSDSATTSYLDISVGSYHGCGVTTTGVLKCWGDGWDGKLGNGDGSGAQYNSPVVADAGTFYKSVAAGRNHTCGISSLNQLKCWGTNSSGQLGDTSATSPRLTPVTIDSSATYSKVAAGENTTCGITTDGVLKCWGANSLGQVGDNSTTTRLSPVVVDSGVPYSMVSLSGTAAMHTCGITTAGILKCWGDNSSGQLGNGTTSASLVPITIDLGTTYKAVSVFWNNTCGITTGGTLKCWGNNAAGQLGIGSSVTQTSPAVVGTGY